METPKEFEKPNGLDNCTLTDISLLREWLSNVCDPRRCETELFGKNKDALDEAGYDNSVARTIAAHKAFSREKVEPKSLSVRVLRSELGTEESSDQRLAA